jgi:hypothetical protein
VSGGAISAADHPQAVRVLDGEFAICHVDLDQAPSLGELEGEFVAITRTPEEITVICPETSVPSWMRAEHGWRALVVEAPFELASAVGVLTALTAPIAAAGIALFAVSTWRTDYILIRGDRLAEGLEALRQAGHRLRVPEPLRW